MMKKILIGFLVLLCTFPILFIQIQADTQFYQDDVPYQTFTVDFAGKLTPTQTAYRPVGVFNKDRVLNNPQDVSIRNGLVYVADAGNKRIAVFNYAGTLVQSIGGGILVNPQGVYASREGFVYVADKGAAKVFKFDASNGDLLQTIGRPTEPLFGSNSVFVPMKIAVGAGENIYVIGDGSTSGVIQLNYDGSFLGYFGVNLSNKPFIQRVADWFVVTDAYAKTTPPSPTNIAINVQSLVYTSTPFTDQALKKLDIKGINILTTTNYNETKNIVDLSVNDEGYVFAIYDDGLVAEYDPSGNLLFTFNVLQANLEILGLVSVPSGIEVDSDGYLFITDSLKNRVVVFEPTQFNLLVHSAINQYNIGGYAQSRLLFEEIERQNVNFALAHSALGKAYFQEGRIDEALEQYRLANDVGGYSETYWKIRDLWLKEHLSTVFMGLIVLIALSFTIKQLKKRTTLFAPIQERWSLWMKDKVVRQYTLLFDILKHPINSYYEIKREKRATTSSATVLLMVMFVLYLWMQQALGYLFNPYPESINLLSQTAIFFGGIGLFVFTNYLIATLSDGEGWLKDVYISSIYSLAPMLLFIIPYVALSNITTLNETVIIRITEFVIIGWTLLLVFLSVKEIHNYEIMETVKNLLMTLFSMLIIVLIGFILYVFGSQLIDFIIEWGKEAWNRVF